jgi:hypothetical protein
VVQNHEPVCATLFIEANVKISDADWNAIAFAEPPV